MVMTTTNKVAFETPTKPVEIKKRTVAAGKSRSIGDVVDVNEKDFIFLVNKGYAIPHLGEAKITKKRKTRKKDDRE